jgi:hypothetical protein
MRLSWFFVSATLVACGAATPREPTVAAEQPEPEPQPEPVSERRPPPAQDDADSKVAVRGIEGSMSSYDVNATMEGQGGELQACHEKRARAVPALSGAVEYRIRVDGEGKVNEVKVHGSDLGDLTLERCVGAVIERTPFPKPNGGDARFSWTMTLEPAYAAAVPEAWEAEQIEQVLDKRLSDLHEECDVEKHARHLGATAYVNKRGRVVAASVTGKSAASDEHLDCIVVELRKWPMPRPKHSRFAKVSFPLFSAQRAIAQRKNTRKR